MRVGGVGRGGTPEEGDDELRMLATQLLRDKLTEIFGMIAEKYRKRIEEERSKL